MKKQRQAPNLKREIRELAEKRESLIQIADSSESGQLIDEIINTTLKDFKELIASGAVSNKDLNSFIKLTEAYTKVEALKLKQAEVEKEVNEDEVLEVISKYLKIKELEDDKD